MSTIHILYLGNNNIVDVSGLRNDLTGDFLADAQVSVALYDGAGGAVGGAQWPMQMDYVTGSNGVYRITLPYLLELREGARYVARIVANAGDGLHGQWDMPCVGRVRT